MPSRNSPGFNPSKLQHSEIWGATDEAVLKKYVKIREVPLSKNPDLEERCQYHAFKLCCGSWFTESGSGSSISSEFGSGSFQSGPRDLMTKIEERTHSRTIFFWRQNYRKSLQPSKESIQHFKKLNLWTLFFIYYFVGHFCPSGSRYGSGHTAHFLKLKNKQ